MSVEAVWDTSEQHAVRIIHHDPWNWEEYYAALDQAIVMMQTKPYRCIVMYDVRESKNLPPNALTNFRISSMKTDPYAEMVLIVGGNAFMGALFNVIKRVAGTWAANHWFLATLEEAQRLTATAKRPPR